jgi:predicted Rossmann-fold nucleotide-binding protein
MLSEHKINEVDLDLMHVTDDVEDVVDTISRHERLRTARG